MNNFGSLFKSQTAESTEIELAVKGKLPDWLEGSLLRTGPALFDIEGERLNHLFDGLAMLYRLAFNGSQNKVRFTSSFVQSDAYKNAKRKGKLDSCEFGTNPKRSKLEVLLSAFNYKATDNPNVNVAFMNGNSFAMTETPFITKFDPHTLQTLDKLEFADGLKGQVTTAHPHFDHKSGEFINFLVEYGPTTSYHLFSWKAGESTNNRKLVASVKTKNPGYLHSFALTEKYVVLILGPFVVNPLALLFSGEPFIANFKWKPQLGTAVYLIERQSGDVIALESDPLFVFHHINARDENGHLVVDFLKYNDASIVQDLYLSNLETGRKNPDIPLPVRWRIDTGSKKISEERLGQKGLELPRINYKRCNKSNYNCLYAVGEKEKGDFLNQLVKIDHTGKQSRQFFWHEKDCYPGEPVFTGKHGGTQSEEDDGVLISLVTNGQSGTSFLIVLDARDMSELARAALPHIIPFNFHGQFREEH